MGRSGIGIGRHSIMVVLVLSLGLVPVDIGMEERD